jgi:hypothetical protein
MIVSLNKVTGRQYPQFAGVGAPVRLLESVGKAALPPVVITGGPFWRPASVDVGSTYYAAVESADKWRPQSVEQSDSWRPSSTNEQVQ